MAARDSPLGIRRALHLRYAQSRRRVHLDKAIDPGTLQKVTGMSGFQVSGDAPTFYMRYSYAMQEPWTDDLISQARCKDGDRVLDVACGPGLVAGRVNQVSNATCKIAGIDVNE